MKLVKLCVNYRTISMHPFEAFHTVYLARKEVIKIALLQCVQALSYIQTSASAQPEANPELSSLRPLTRKKLESAAATPRAWSLAVKE